MPGSGVTSGLRPGRPFPRARGGPGAAGGVRAAPGEPAGLWLRPPGPAPPPLPPAEADVEATARAAAGGGGAEARGSRPSRGRAVATAVAAAAAREVEAEAEAEEAAEGGVRAARPRLQQEAMNGDRTESDWQGLVSEVRPRRQPGGKGRAVPRGWPSRAGTRARSEGNVHRGLPRPALRDPPGALLLLSSRSCPGHFPPRHLVTARGEGGAFPPRGWAGDWSVEPGSGREERAPSPTCLPSSQFWSQAIGRPALKWEGGAGEIRALGQHWARWHSLK